MTFSINLLVVNHECMQCVEVPANRLDRYDLGSLFTRLGWDILNDNFVIKAYPEDELRYRYKYHKLEGYNFYHLDINDDEEPEPEEFSEKDYGLKKYTQKDYDEIDDSDDSDYDPAEDDDGDDDSEEEDSDVEDSEDETDQEDGEEETDDKDK